MRQLTGHRKGKETRLLAFIDVDDTWTIQGEWIVVNNVIGEFVSAYRIFHDVTRITQEDVKNEPVSSNFVSDYPG